MDFSNMNCRETLAALPERFDSSAAGRLKTDIQFCFTGGEEGVYYLHIEDGVCTFREGLAPSPSMTLTCPSDIWMQVVRREISGSQAFMEGELRMEGNLALGLRLFQLFHLS